MFITMKSRSLILFYIVLFNIKLGKGHHVPNTGKQQYVTHYGCCLSTTQPLSEVNQIKEHILENKTLVGHTEEDLCPVILDISLSHNQFNSNKEFEIWNVKERSSNILNEPFSSQVIERRDDTKPSLESIVTVMKPQTRNLLRYLKPEDEDYKPEVNQKQELTQTYHSRPNVRKMKQQRRKVKLSKQVSKPGYKEEEEEDYRVTPLDNNPRRIQYGFDNSYAVNDIDSLLTEYVQFNENELKVPSHNSPYFLFSKKNYDNNEEGEEIDRPAREARTISSDKYFGYKTIPGRDEKKYFIRNKNVKPKRRAAKQKIVFKLSPFSPEYDEKEDYEQELYSDYPEVGLYKVLNEDDDDDYEDQASQILTSYSGRDKKATEENETPEPVPLNTIGESHDDDEESDSDYECENDGIDASNKEIDAGNNGVEESGQINFGNASGDTSGSTGKIGGASNKGDISDIRGSEISSSKGDILDIRGTEILICIIFEIVIFMEYFSN